MRGDGRPCGPGLEATHIAIDGMEGMTSDKVFLTMSRRVNGKRLWSRSIELSVAETTGLITELYKARNKAAEVDSRWDLVRAR